MNVTEQLEQMLTNADSEGYSRRGWIEFSLVREALQEIKRLQTGDIDAKLQLVPEDQVWQDRRRFDQFFAAAITGLASCKDRGLASSIAWNAATIALEAMNHRFPGQEKGIRTAPPSFPGDRQTL
jgi:hypothetical protein